MNKFIYELGGSLYLNLTNKCSNACDFCIRNFHDGVGDEESLWLEREPSAAEIIEKLETVDLSVYKEVIFCGFGEPIYKLEEILAIGKFLKSHGVKTRINTNGQGNLIHGRDISAEICTVLDKINVSLNASTPEKYDAVCHSRFGKNGFTNMLYFAKCCREHGARVILSVVDTIPHEDIEACRKMAEELGTEFRVRKFE